MLTIVKVQNIVFNLAALLPLASYRVSIKVVQNLVYVGISEKFERYLNIASLNLNSFHKRKPK